MYIFGINIPILELLVILCVVVVVYLIILEFEFRQVKKIVKEFDEEEVKLSHEIRELREAVSDLKEVAERPEVRVPASSELKDEE